jgi:hypothetical protein
VRRGTFNAVNCVRRETSCAPDVSVVGAVLAGTVNVKGSVLRNHYAWIQHRAGDSVRRGLDSFSVPVRGRISTQHNLRFALCCFAESPTHLLNQELSA